MLNRALIDEVVQRTGLDFDVILALFNAGWQYIEEFNKQPRWERRF